MRSPNSKRAAVLAALTLMSLGCEAEQPAAPETTQSAKPEATAILSAATAVTSAAKPAQAKATKPTAEQLADRWMDCMAAVDGGDGQKLKECYGDEVKLSLVDALPAVEPEGFDAVAAHHQELRGSFSELRHELGLILIHGDNVVVVGTVYGKHSGLLARHKASNKRMAVMYASHAKIGDDGKALKLKIYSDQTSMMGQLGLLPKQAGEAFRPADLAQKWDDTQIVIAKDDQSEKDNLAAYDKLVDTFNKHQVKGYLEGLADQAIVHHVAMEPDAKGKKEIGAGLDALMKTSSDVKRTVEWKFAAGNYVVAGITETGSFDGDMGKVKATKKPFTLHELMVTRMAGGKCQRMWLFSNSYKWAVDVGLSPAPELGKGGDKDGTKAEVPRPVETSSP